MAPFEFVCFLLNDACAKVWDVRAAVPVFTLAASKADERVISLSISSSFLTLSVHNNKVMCVGWTGNTVLTGGTDKVLRSYVANLDPLAVQ